MDKLILLNSLLIAIACLVGIVSILFMKIELNNSKPFWLKQEEKRKRYITPIDDYIVNQENRKGGWGH